MSIRRRIRFSNHPAAKLVRGLYYLPAKVSLPCPTPIVRPLMHVFVSLRNTFWFCQRILIAEPFFKAYCTEYGKRLHTGKYLHWIQGSGEIRVGDDVTIDGKCSIAFAARYTEHPQLIIGDHTGISHGCSFRIGKKIEIGKYCRLAGEVEILDAPGHSSDPEARMAGAPAPDEDVRPVKLEDNVWIGRRATIMPGVRIGENAIVASCSAVFSDVPANAIVGGNPARIMGSSKDQGRTRKYTFEDPGVLVKPAPQSVDIVPSYDHLSALLEEVIDLVREVGKIQQLSSDEDFYEAGLSSMASLTLMLEIEQRYQLTLPDEEFLVCRTANELGSLISTLRPAVLHEARKNLSEIPGGSGA